MEDKYNEIDFDKLHDAILDIFDIRLSDIQLYKLCTLIFKEKRETFNFDDFSALINQICIKIVNHPVPTFGSSEEESARFWLAVEAIKDKNFENFIITALPGISEQNRLRIVDISAPIFSKKISPDE